MRDFLKRSLRRIFSILGFEVQRTGDSTHAFDHTFQRLAALRDLGFYPDTIYDIGASNGRWSRRCMEIFPHAQYFMC